IMRIRYRVDINTGEHEVARTITKNEIVSCEISLSEKIVLDSFSSHRTLGSFILINRVTNMTSACGTIAHIMRRSDNLHYQKEAVTRKERALLKGQQPFTIWFTGLSGSGKSTLANEIEKRLHARMKHTMLLDGDNMRMGLNKNLGFTKQDRIENIRRTAEVCKILNDAGLIALTAFISPYEADRENARQIVGDGNFIEVYVSTSLDECKRRDTHGLYRKALNGEIPNMTGITSPYEVPSHPEITVDTEGRSIEDTANELMERLEKIFSERKLSGDA
ncbi:MAG: adenylyl-sulfate kinase, partial [Lachnospiraceae bacterium]|nr:adenylyl-sulfate kinase [Lachnospiraceae bacterium]